MRVLTRPLSNVMLEKSSVSIKSNKKTGIEIWKEMWLDAAPCQTKTAQTTLSTAPLQILFRTRVKKLDDNSQ